jgi:hypothetical protein
MAESNTKIEKSIVKKEKKDGRERCIEYVHQSRPFNSLKSSGPALMGGSLLPLKNLKDEAAGQLKININYLWKVMRKGGPPARRSCRIPEQSYLSHKEDPMHIVRI